MVLITNMEHGESHEHSETLFDKFFRAVSGKTILISSDLSRYEIKDTSEESLT